MKMSNLITKYLIGPIRELHAESYTGILAFRQDFLIDQTYICRWHR